VQKEHTLSRVVVVGARGRTGLLIVKALIKHGDAVVATIRNPKHMAEMVKLGAETHVLDLDTSPLADVEHAFAGADAVVFAAGSAESDPKSDIDRKGVQRTVRVAMKAKVPRYVAISALGATTKLPKTFDWPGMKAYYAAKKTANKVVRNSSLFWTIIEPGSLSDGRATGKIALSEGKDEVADKKISRADVAATVLAVLAEPKSAGHTFQIVGGATEIAKAVKAAVRP
jgi:uncharacterized protein YbjT (DUF2867 family)